MSPRLSSFLLAVVIAAAVSAHDLRAQQGTESVASLEQVSLEWLVCDSDVVVRGVVVDFQAGTGNWKVVTVEVRETFKGAGNQRLRFAVHQCDVTDAALARAKASKREALCLLKRQDLGKRGGAPDREAALARLQIDLYATALRGRVTDPALSVIPLSEQDFDKNQSPVWFLTFDLRPLKTPGDLLKAVREAVAATGAGQPVRSYSLALPRAVAQQSGFSSFRNHLTLPTDQRLAALGRRLVLSPTDFTSAENAEQLRLLRLEGVKVLRQFPTESNLAVIRAWLDDPLATRPYEVKLTGQTSDLIPAAPKAHQAGRKIALPQQLADVPEIHFQQPLTKALATADAHLHTACTIDAVQSLNREKADGFIETLRKTRPDLSGLSFAMGDSCRMTAEAGKQFAAALDVLHKAEATSAEPGTKHLLFKTYQQQSTQDRIDPSACVASLMQVLGPEYPEVRFGLVEYLDGIDQADAARALAQLAIFSEEAYVRSAALKALKARPGADFTEVLLKGLNYPWPAVAERACDAIVKLERTDLIPHLIEVLESPDPRAPQVQEVNGQKVPVVREVVRLNHHHNCLLCHAPAGREGESKDAPVNLTKLRAQVPVPSESMVRYYQPDNPDILVRFDVTYLRQDFSLKLPVANADPWPEKQRYDFLTRRRTVSAEEARAYQELLRPSGPEGLSPYRRAAVSALRQLTGMDTAPTAEAWRALTGL